MLAGFALYTFFSTFQYISTIKVFVIIHNKCLKGHTMDKILTKTVGAAVFSVTSKKCERFSTSTS